MISHDLLRIAGCCACQITPSGLGGIATIQVGGDDALSVVARLFRGRRSLELSSRLCYGVLQETGAAEAIDEVVVTGYAAEISPTAQPLIEICCHGGRAVATKILELLRRHGAEIATPEQWQGRLAQYRLRLEQEALTQFLHSRTALASRLFLYQTQGVWPREIARLTGLLNDRPDQIASAIDGLLATAPLGQALVQPQRIVIAGSVNVGKSTLLNVLLGRERVLVDAQPGTTRDVVCEAVVIGGIPFYLSDTAGLRSTDDPIEALGIGRTNWAMQEADRLIWVYDLTRPLAGQASPPLPNEKIIVVGNKLDAASQLDEYREKFPQAIAISALTGVGLDSLQTALTGALRPLIPDTPAPIVFATWQEQCLRDAQQAIAVGQPGKASQCLRQILQ